MKSIFNSTTKKLGRVSKVLAVATLAAGISMANAADTIKVGVLHSLSGTMAISETTLKDTVLMMIEEQNKKGGLLGKQLEPVVVDPASNWPLFAEKPASFYRKKTLMLFSAAGLQYHVNRFCRLSKN